VLRGHPLLRGIRPALAARFSSQRAAIRGYPSMVTPRHVSPRGDPALARVFDTAIIVFMASTVAIERPANWPAAAPFAAAGAACVVAGGLVAAATALAPSQLASWTTAYLVLVGGVAQAALGTGQALLTARPPGRPGIAAELTAWNGGNGAVLAGTLLGASWLADVGGVLLAAVLALMIAATGGAARQPAWPLHLYRALAALLLVSIPAGLVIAGLRPH
jgi:hypothetical protein